VQVRLLVGPAGSGKTVRCLTEARRALLASTEGPPLILLAPKQGTYQLEQQLLSDPSLAGYTRLHIVSFESLAQLVLDWLQKPSPRLLDKEGRLMVLRNLLVSHRSKLKLFRASARLTGFAEQLSLVLQDLQSHCLAPAAVNELALKVQHVEGLAYKLQDLATLLQEYLDWLKAHKLQDADWLLTAAAEALRDSREDPGQLPGGESLGSDPNPSQSPPLARLCLDQLWVDGFAEFSQQELAFLEALVPACQQATLTFCMPRVPAANTSWLSPWSLTGKTYHRCYKRIAAVPGAEIVVEHLPHDPTATRFCANPVLQHLERHWGEPVPCVSSGCAVEKSLRMVACLNPEAEARFAAREIVKFVRAGARFRDVSVLVRNLERYHQVLQRVFSRF